MSRFAADPRWLIYLPPTMSPPETTTQPGLLEHPAEAFAYYRAQGVDRVVCEEKHMGSRAVVIVCRDAEAARRRFGVDTGEAGIVVTRTGRRFFPNAALETQFTDRVRAAVARAGLFAEFDTTWVCLDCELMPWSAKARDLLKTQYAAVGAAGAAAIPQAVAGLAAAGSRLTGPEADKLATVAARLDRQAGAMTRFVAAYRQYCWPTDGLTGLKLAPFHLLATENKLPR